MEPLPPTDSPAKLELFRLLVDRVRDYAIFALDPSGIVASWNTGAQHIKGYAAGEIVGHHFSRFYPEEAIRAGWPQTELRLARENGRFEDEGWRIRKDGTRFWANVVITALTDDSGEIQGYAKITRDLTDRQRIERLEADAQVMGDFVAMLAHELRNPLAPIRNAVEIGRQSLTDPRKFSWALDVIDRQSKHLSNLVDDLLDVSRISRGLIRLKRRKFILSSALDIALESAAHCYENKQQSLTVQRLDNPVVRGDQVRITQILSNLLNNASKYTPVGGSIDVCLEVSEAFASIRIRDSGIGIAPEVLPRVFDLFTQDKRSLDRAEGGLGLGLAIAKKLALMHDGRLTAASAGRGCGSEFVLSLPLVKTLPPKSQSLKCSILIVDDNRDAAITMQSMLELFGYACETAFDGISGLRAVRELVPDVIILDIGLPDMDGYQVAREIRGLPELEGVLIIAVTGYSGESDARRALEAGFDVHLAKPVSVDELSRHLELVG